MGTVMGASYPPPVDLGTKPIIFWGVWLYFGPSGIGALWLLGARLVPLIAGEVKIGEHPEVIAMLIAAALYGFASLWVLWSVTARFFKKDRTTQT
jgi:hypothetical protein